MNNYDWLISSLDAFIRKYYANKVIRGSLIFISSLLLFLVAASVGEYYLYMPVWARLSLAGFFVTSGLAALVGWVIIPLTKMARLGKVISHEQAAQIIGAHFGEVNDKLLNILQLKRDAGTGSRELAEASINQKISQISVVPMLSAIDLGQNRKYLKFLLPVLLVGLFIIIAAPNVFKESTARLLQPAKEFEKPAPFKFKVVNPELVAVRNTDFVLKLQVEGDVLPAQAFISPEGTDDKMVMQLLEHHQFSYTFRNITKPVQFRFFAGGYYSIPYTIKVVQKPILKSFRLTVNYPAYTGRKNEVRTSLGDITVPAGTTITWQLNTEYTDNAAIKLAGGNPTPLKGSNGNYSYSYRFLSDTSYMVLLTNNTSKITDSYSYHTQVIQDQYPVIQLQRTTDTVTGKQIILTGTAGDDYAVTRVTFNYEVLDNKKTIAKKTVPLQINAGALAAFRQYFDLETLHLAPGQKVQYYIEAWDNDGVRGSKSSRSEMMSYQMYDADQIDSAINENAQQISSGLSNTSQTTKELQNDMRDLQTKMLQTEQMDWNQQQSLEELLKKQMELKNNLENAQQRFEEQIQQSEQKKYSDEVREKQKELQKQMDNLLNNELKEQLKKLQEMMQKMNKDHAVEAMKKMQQDNKLFNMDMQRLKELMNKLDQQMKMEDLATKAAQLADKEEKLQKETENGAKDAEQLKKEQEQLTKELEKALKDDLKDIEKLAKENKKEEGLDNIKEKGQGAEKDMKNSEQQLQQQNKGNASKSQKSAAQQLREMSKSLSSAAGGMSPEQIDIDIRATRQILSNLIRLSFSQEDLMSDVERTSPASQKYVENMEEQARLRQNAAMIRDSLFALSKRLEKLPVDINKKTTELERHMNLAVEKLEQRDRGQARVDQQYVMTKTNDLALILNELLANLMQQQMMSSSGAGSGMSMPMPGAKPSPGSGQQLSDIITEQENLGSAMEQLGNKMGKKPGQKPGDKPGQKPSDKQGGQQPGDKPGDKPGGKQPGGKQPGGQSGENGSGQGGSGSGGEDESENMDAETLARLAEQQATIRRKIQELASKLNSKGMNGAAKDLHELQQQMDRNETDLVNKRLSQEMLSRQKEILTRLLKTEKAVREQEQDDKRSSKTAGDISRPVPAALQKYITEQKQLLELYKTVPPQLKPYYKQIVDEYYKIIGNK